MRRGEEPLLAAELVLGRHLLVPDDLAVVAVDGDDAAVGQVGDARGPPRARCRACARCCPRAARRGRPPRRTRPCRVARVDLVDRAPAVARVHEAVVDERIDLVLGTVLSDVLHAAERQRPHHPQVLDVVAVDLRQLRVAQRAVVAVHQQPVLRLVLRVDQPVLVDGQRVLGRKGGGGGHHADGAGKEDA